MDGEVNVLRKKDAPLRVALAFPDIYDVGMSHLGLRILYHIINGLEFASAERVFHPWLDLEKEMLDKGMPLSSLETGTPLSEFDAVGFSLQYEMSYTSVLNMLRLGGIPLRSGERGRSHPIVIAGGPCTVNPLPMAPFIDAFLVGDGEDAITEILGALRGWRHSGGAGREAALKTLAGIGGVYVPSVSGGVKRRLIGSLEDAPYPVSPVVPFTEIVHDRVNIEVSRGCTMGCRFCQAGMIYRPLRERSPGRALEIAETSIRATGYEEAAFTSLSAGDYSGLLPLLRGFNRRFASSNVAISLPSLRVKAVNEDVLREIRSVRKTGFTIAPEAATERLRAVINKAFSEEDFERAVEVLFREGWLNLKLYYMVGLPGERDEDIEAIPAMVKKAVRAARRHSSRFVNISVSVSPFVPKAHTPFQWCAQADLDDIRRRKQYIRDRLKKVNFRGHDEETSVLEAAFARGDGGLSVLLEAAFEEGARLEGWSESFSYEKWQRAMERTGVDVTGYALRGFGKDDALPWEFVDVGVSKGFLREEYERALRAESTADCREECAACGLGCEGLCAPTEVSEPSRPYLQAVPRKPVKVRVGFSKTGVMRNLSHRELMTHIIRAIRRVGVQLEYSKGFHPSPRISFGPPLGVGVAGLRECFDIEMAPSMSLSMLKERMNEELADGVRVHAMAPVGQGAPSLQGFVSKYVYDVATSEPGRAGEFMRRQSTRVAREKGDVDIRRMVEHAIETGPGVVRLTLRDLADTKVRLEEVLTEMFGRPISEIDVTRVVMYGYKDGGWEVPMGAGELWQAAS